MSTTNIPEQRTATIAVENVRTEGRILTGFAALYDSESRDLGGYTETILPGAFADVLAADPDVYLTLNHSPDRVLARTTSGTLRLRDEERGLAFEADLGDGPTAQDVRDMVKRGDVTGASFRFVVAPDGERWDGERRTLTRIGELIDLSLATTPAYNGPRVELRTKPEDKKEKETVNETAEETQEDAEERASTPKAGGLRVGDVNSGQPENRTLLGAFKRAGWEPGRRAEVAWNEYAGASESRALTWTGSVDNVNMYHAASGAFGADQRYAWPAFPQVPVDPGVTSVQVLTQTARTLPVAATVVRAVDAITNKPEAASTLTLVATAMKQLAAVQTGVPNVMLENDRIESVIGTDLRLSINEGLDKLILDAIAASGFQAPGTDPLLVSIRKAMTTIYASGYNPNLLILTPAASESLDILQTVGTEKLYVFGAGRFAPGELFGMSVRVSKTVAAPAVVDSSALGRLYVGPISLASFEENAGRTNTTLVRMEGNGVFGVERQNAAVRIAAA